MKLDMSVIWFLLSISNFNLNFVILTGNPHPHCLVWEAIAGDIIDATLCVFLVELRN